MSREVSERSAAPTRGRRARAIARVALAASIGVVGLDITLRVLAPRVPTLRRLAYNPNDPITFDDARDLEGLLRRTLLGHAPRTEFAGFILNDRSLRTPEYAVAPAAGARRVVLLGDSFTFVSGGVPWELHWPELLESELARRGGGTVEVVNLSYPAVGPRFYRRMWELEGRRLGADLVVVGLFVGNDFSEEQGRRAAGRALPGIKEWIVDHSVLARSARNAWRIRRGVRFADFNRSAPATYPRGGAPIPGAVSRYDPERPTFAEDAYLELQAGLMALFAEDARDRFDPMFDDVSATLRDLHRDVTATGARFVVAVFPAEFQVDDELMAAVARHAGRAAEDYDVLLPITRLVTSLRGEGIEAVDLGPALRARAVEAPVYQPRDTHWNAEGDRVVAESLAAYLSGDG